MCYLKKILLLFILSTVFNFSNGQNASKVDTIDIYKNKTGVSFKMYMRTWFSGYGLKNSYSWNPNKVNKQDSIVMYSDKKHFYRVRDKNGRLLFTGNEWDHGEMLNGNVTFYYKDGTIKRIEYWSSDYKKDTCGISLLMDDAPGKQGTWLFYRRNGNIRKKYEYYISVYSCSPYSYCIEKKIYKFNLRGKLRNTKTKKIQCRTDKKTNIA